MDNNLKNLLANAKVLVSESPYYAGDQSLAGPAVATDPTYQEPYHTTVIRANANLATATVYLNQAVEFVEAAANAMAAVSTKDKEDLLAVCTEVKKAHKSVLDAVKKVTG